MPAIDLRSLSIIPQSSNFLTLARVALDPEQPAFLVGSPLLERDSRAPTCMRPSEGPLWSARYGFCHHEDRCSASRPNSCLRTGCICFRPGRASVHLQIYCRRDLNPGRPGSVLSLVSLCDTANGTIGLAGTAALFGAARDRSSQVDYCVRAAAPLFTTTADPESCPKCPNRPLLLRQPQKAIPKSTNPTYNHEKP